MKIEGFVQSEMTEMAIKHFLKKAQEPFVAVIHHVSDFFYEKTFEERDRWIETLDPEIQVEISMFTYKDYIFVPFENEQDMLNFVNNHDEKDDNPYIPGWIKGEMVQLVKVLQNVTMLNCNKEHLIL